MRKPAFFVLLLIALASQSPAQAPLQFPFVHYGQNEGLAATNVRGVWQDSTGYIWIATESGLQRYDGVRYLSFFHEKDNPFSIPDNNIRALSTDALGRLWLSFDNGKTGIFNTSSFRFTEIPVKAIRRETAKIFKKLFCDSQGRVFFSDGDELYVFEPGKAEQVFRRDKFILPVSACGKIYSITEDSLTRKYWIGTDSGLVVFNSRSGRISYPGHNAEKEPLVDAFRHLRYVGYVFIDRRHRLWLSNWPPSVGAALLHCADLNRNTVVLGSYSLMPVVNTYHEILGLLEQNDGSLWIYGAPVLARFDESRKIFEPVFNGYSNEYSISFDGVNQLSEDREGSIWVATNNNGLYRFNPSQQSFRNIRVRNRFNGNPGDGSLLSFCEDRDGTVLAGAWSNGLYRFDTEWNPLPLGIKGIDEKNEVFVWCMLKSRDGKNILMGTQPGLYIYNMAGRQASYLNPPRLKGKTIRQLAQDSAGHLWLGMHGSGLYKWEEEPGAGMQSSHIVKIPEVPDKLITALLTAPDGLVWAGTNADGVYVIDPGTNRVVRHLFTEGLPGQQLLSDQVADILLLDNQTLVIAAGGLSIYHLATGTIRNIALPGNLPPSLAAVEKGKDGYLWVSANSGLYRVDTARKIFIHYQKVDGIINDHFILGASRALADGRLLFGCSNQFVVFDPARFSDASSAPAVEITGVRLMNHALSVDSLQKRGKLDLNHNQNSLTFEFSGLNYNGAYLIYYRMEGLETDWKIAGKANQAVYSYLPPGNYSFQARSQDAAGNMGPVSASLSFRIRPPFWRTWWFGSLMIFALFGLLYWLDKQRTQKIRATESIRTRIATSLTEDMISSLSSINISSELARNKAGIDSVRVREYINQISDTSHRMVQSMNDMVWSIDPENDSMQRSIERMKSFAAELEALHPVDIVFDIDQSVEDPELDMQHRYELLAIFKEAVSNAARHSGARHIQVAIRYKRPRFSLLVQDDGRGFEVEGAEMGRGISDMRRRAAAIGAHLEIRSELNTGTSIQLLMNV